MYLSKHQGGNSVSSAEQGDPKDTKRWKKDVLEAYLGVTLKRQFSTGPDAFDEIYRRLEQFTRSLIEHGDGAAGDPVPPAVVDTVTSLALAIDAKDRYTQGHSQKVSAYSVMIAQALRMNQAEVEEIRLAGLLHDIGKVGIPEIILNKSGPLDATEWTTMKTHTELGAKILEPLAAMNRIREMVRHHHEFYDGTGYPDRLSADQIPLGARVIAIADAYDTITSERTYKKARNPEEAFSELERCAANQFDPDIVRGFVEAMRRAFADRAEFLADPDFAKIPVRGLTSVCYADVLRHSIDATRASESKSAKAGDPAPFENQRSDESCPAVTEGRAADDSPDAQLRALAEAAHGGHTTHFSVVDAAGNAVANTYTLNDSFGSGVTTGDGYLLNDEMDDFTAHPGSPNMFGLMQSEANTIAPGKRPLSSMTPTILLRDGQLSFVTGSPGGPTIISAVLLTVLNWMRLGMDAQSAINAPRFHQQWLPDFVGAEPIFSDAVEKDLESRGYKLFPTRAWIGQVEAIGIDANSGERLGAADQRRKGSALGY